MRDEARHGRREPDGRERLYRSLLRILPPGFRARYGAEMAEVFLELRRDAQRRGRGAVALLYVCLTIDIARRAAIEWWRAIIRGRGLAGMGGSVVHDGFRQDLRYSVRLLRRRPVFALTVVGVLGLGIGLNAAMLSVIRGTLLSPLPFPDADRVRVVWGVFEEQGWSRAALSIPEIQDVEERAPELGPIGVFRTGVNMGERTDGPAAKVKATFVNSAFFRTLGIGAERGRTFTPEEDVGPGAHPVVVLSHGYWRSRFGGDPAAVGSEIELSGGRYRVVGVMPRSFVGPGSFEEPTDVWVPLTMGRPFFGSDMFETRRNRMYGAVLRLPEGMSPAVAESRIDRVFAELEGEYPDTHRGRSGDLWTLHEFYFGDLSGPVRLLFAGAALVLLICGVNVAAMLLVQTRERDRELAMRMALGARRGRVIRQMLTEALTLAALGGVLGVAIAAAAADTIVSAYDLGLPTFATPRLDAWSLGACAVLLGVTGILFGLYPALRQTRALPRERVQGGERGWVGRGHRARGGAVVLAEVALAVVLLVGAGLVTRSLIRLQNTPLGFEKRGLLTMQLDLTESGPPPADPATRADQELRDDLRRARFAEDLLQRVRSLPGVRAAALLGPNPLGRAHWHIRFTPEGQDPTRPENQRLAQRLVVSPGALETLGIPLLRGRDFTAADRLDASQRVAIIDRRLAERYWPGRDPIGRRFHSSDGGGSVYTVVGVVANAKHRGRLAPSDLVPGDVYVPYLMQPWNRVTLNVRTDEDPSAVAPIVREAIGELDPGVVAFDVSTAVDRLRREESIPRFVTTIMTVYAGIAAFLAVVGTYGILAYTVRRRRREIAVRSALGASSRNLLLNVLRQGLLPVLGGIALGLGAASALAEMARGLLFGIEGFDPLVFAAVAATVLFAGLLASLLPAYQAGRIDPMTALRTD